MMDMLSPLQSPFNVGRAGQLSLVALSPGSWSMSLKRPPSLALILSYELLHCDCIIVFTLSEKSKSIICARAIGALAENANAASYAS